MNNTFTEKLSAIKVFSTHCEFSVTVLSNQWMRIWRIPADGSADINAKFRLFDSLKSQEHASWCGSRGLHKHEKTHLAHTTREHSINNQLNFHLHFQLTKWQKEVWSKKWWPAKWSLVLSMQLNTIIFD